MAPCTAAVAGESCLSQLSAQLDPSQLHYWGRAGRSD